ncbi:hypothetical protein [Pararhodobacter sp.]|jgi:hypothetical protein
MYDNQRHPFRNSERAALIADALGAMALFVLLLAALHLPVFA